MKLFKGAPPNPPTDICEWAEHNVRLIGSVRSETYDRNITPWTIEPIRRCADNETNIVTLIKPVQTGGTRVGLIALAWWLKFGYGQIQYNWEKDEKAFAKWQDETLPTLKACRVLDWSGERFEAVSGYAKFRRTFLRCQGVFNPDNLDSDSIPFQVNEEIHSWKPGHLAKARGRQTAVWFPKAVDISNAGSRGDQLEQTFLDGTMQRWEVKCPGCGNYHVMRTRWEDSKPELGGLRYKCLKLDNGRYNYNSIQIWYQMPCGQQIADNTTERRSLSLTGRYSAPGNAGAHLSHRSYTYDAVTVDFISWLQLIQEKHNGLRALKAGDAEPWRRYITERECDFYSDESRPFSGSVLIKSGLKKNRIGLPDRAARLWAADAQKGYRRRGELSHYWLVIRDVMENCDSQLVFEGAIQTDLDLIATLDDHLCQRRCGVIDATWDTKRIMEFCYRNNINATLGSARQEWFAHPDKVRRFYSVPKPIHAELNVPPKFNYNVTPAGWLPANDEPLVWHYNKAGLLSNLMFLRNHQQTILAANSEAKPWEYIAHDVPGDVTEDYKLQNESWERKASTRGRSKEQIEEWQQVREADHMLLCEGYIAMLMEMEGFVGNRLTQLGIENKPTTP